MKIERINENQIKCVLTREDLENRQMKLSELAYGTDKARDLFQDMIQQANTEFGFEVNDIPLLVEAVPMSQESVVLLITKVDYPEELDTRFAHFTEADEEDYPGYESFQEPEEVNTASDVLDFFEKVRRHSEELRKDRENGAGELEKVISEAARQVAPEIETDMIKLFEFHSYDQLERLSKVLKGYYHGSNDLYKNQRSQRYELLMHKSAHTPAEFNKICNIASEYARQKNFTPMMGAYFKEHGSVLIQSDALQEISQL